MSKMTQRFALTTKTPMPTLAAVGLLIMVGACEMEADLDSGAPADAEALFSDEPGDEPLTVSPTSDPKPPCLDDPCVGAVQSPNTYAITCEEYDAFCNEAADEKWFACQVNANGDWEKLLQCDLKVNADKNSCARDLARCLRRRQLQE